jgi:hypothetical protein
VTHNILGSLDPPRSTEKEMPSNSLVLKRQQRPEDTITPDAPRTVYAKIGKNCFQD